MIKLRTNMEASLLSCIFLLCSLAKLEQLLHDDSSLAAIQSRALLSACTVKMFGLLEPYLSHLSCIPCGCIIHHTSSSSNFNQHVFTELLLLFF